MAEPDQAGMQRLAVEGRHGPPRRLRGVPETPPHTTAIQRVADDGMAQAGHMDANLMGASGGQPALDQAGPGSD